MHAEIANVFVAGGWSKQKLTLQTFNRRPALFAKQRSHVFEQPVRDVRLTYALHL